MPQTERESRTPVYGFSSCTERLTEAEIEPSIGSVGEMHNNALAENVIGLFKTGIIR
jgi:putative transposase